MPWKDIFTAPRDGTVIEVRDVYWPRNFRASYWNFERLKAEGRDDYEHGWYEHFLGLDEDGHELVEPVRWFDNKSTGLEGENELSGSKAMEKSRTSVIRAVFSCAGSPIDDITIDLIVDENRNWIESILASGWWGNPDSNDVWPFILKSGGVLDFGSNIDEPAASDERFGSLVIAGKPLAKGARFHFCYGEISANLELIHDELLTTSS